MFIRKQKNLYKAVPNPYYNLAPYLSTLDYRYIVKQISKYKTLSNLKKILKEQVKDMCNDIFNQEDEYNEDLI